MSAASETSRRTSGAQEVAMLFSARASVLSFGLLIQSLLAYFLLPEGRGSYAICVTFAVLAGVIVTPGIDKGVTYNVVTGRMSVSRGVATALAIIAGGTAAAVVVAVPLINSGVGFFSAAEPASFHLALILIPITTAATAVEQLLVGLRGFGSLAGFWMIRAVVNLLALLILVAQMELGVNGAIAAFAAGQAFMTAACVLRLRKGYGLTGRAPSRAGFSLALNYGWRFHYARIAFAAEARIGVLLLGIIASTREIGLFDLALALMLQFGVIASMVGSVLFPRVTEDERSRPELVALCIRLVFAATTGAMAIFLAVIALSPLFPLFFTKRFLPVVDLLVWLAPGGIAHACSAILATYLMGSNRPGALSGIIWTGIGVNAVVLFAAYPVWGLQGAAWAMSAGFIMRTLLMSVVFHRASGAGVAATWLPKRSDFVYVWTEGRAAIRQTLGRRAAHA